MTWFARFSEELRCDVIISIVTHDIHCMTTNRVDTGHDAIQTSFGRTDGKCPHHFLSFHNSKDFPKVSTVKKPKEKPHFTLTKPNFNIFIYMILQSKIFNHKTYYFLHGFWSKKERKVFSKLMFPSWTSQLVWRNINLRLFVVSSTASSRYIQSHYRTSWVVHLLIRKSIQMEGGGHEIMICLDFAIVSSNYQAENSSINF